MNLPTKRLRHIQVVAVALLSIAGMVNYLDRSSLSIANHVVSGELQLTGTEMGMLLSAFSLSYAFAQLPVGVLLDRFGARVVLGIGLCLWSLAQMAGGFVHTLGQFILARIILGVAEAPLFPAGAKVVNEWFPPHKRGGPTGLFVSSGTLSSVFAPPLLTVLMLTFGWRSMFVIMGALGLIVGIIWCVIYRNRHHVSLDRSDAHYLKPDVNDATTAKKFSFADWGNLLRQRNTWGMIVGYAGVIYMVWLYIAWLPGYLEHERHLSIASTGWLLAIPYVFGTIGMAISGYIADGLMRRGMAPIKSRKWPICLGLVLAAAFTVPAAYVPGTGWAITFISCALFFINLASGGAWALVTVAATPHQVGSLGSMQNFGGYIGGAFAPFITGVMLDKTHSFTGALVLSAGIACVSALIYLLVVKDRPSTTERRKSSSIQYSH